MKQFLLTVSLVFFSLIATSELVAQDLSRNQSAACQFYPDFGPVNRATSIGEVQVMNGVYQGIAQQYDNLPPVTISAVFIDGRVNPSFGSSINLKVVIYSVAQGLPGTILNSSTFVMDTSTFLFQTLVPLSSPVTLSGSIIISIEPVSIASYDFFIARNTPPDGLNLNLIKIKQANQWFKNLAAGDPSFDYDLMILPVSNVTVTAAFTEMVAGATVNLSNNSSNATDYLWDFGDGDTSTQMHTSHTYSAIGSYTVKLKAIRQGVSGCEDSVSKVINILVAGINNPGAAQIITLTRGNTVRSSLYLSSPKEIDFTLYTVSGQMAGTYHINGGSEEKIDVTGLSPGSYIIKGEFSPLRFVKL